MNIKDTGLPGYMYQFLHYMYIYSRMGILECVFKILSYSKVWKKNSPKKLFILLSFALWVLVFNTFELFNKYFIMYDNSKVLVFFHMKNQLPWDHFLNYPDFSTNLRLPPLWTANFPYKHAYISGYNILSQCLFSITVSRASNFDGYTCSKTCNKIMTILSLFHIFTPCISLSEYIR